MLVSFTGAGCVEAQLVSPYWSFTPALKVFCIYLVNRPKDTTTPTQLYPLGNATPRQAQAKQQKRQILARQEEAKVGGRERGTSEAGGPTPTLSSSTSLTDGEGNNFPRRDRRRHWQAGRASEESGGCHSDSEVVMCDKNSASRWVCCLRYIGKTIATEVVCSPKSLLCVYRNPVLVSTPKVQSEIFDGVFFCSIR